MMFSRAFRTVLQRGLLVTGSASTRVPFVLASTALVASAVAVTQSDENKTQPSSTTVPQKERIEGHYNNRIRQYSTPEKIFGTFASGKDAKSGDKLMTYNDLRDALLPYDFRSKSDSQPLGKKKVPPFLRQLIGSTSDDGKERISFASFMLITSLLSISPSDFELAFRMFDLDGNGNMDSEEFAVLMEHFRVQSTSAFDFNSAARRSPIFDRLFRADNNNELSLEEFSNFLLQLRETVLWIEFQRFTINNPKIYDSNALISPASFALSLVCYAEHRQIPWYMARINRIPKDMFAQVSYAEFRDFNTALHNLQKIIRALRMFTVCKEEVTKKAFKHAVRSITDIDLSDNIIDIIFFVFDKDGDNRLDYKEIDAVLGKRFLHGYSGDRTFGFAKYVGCFVECVQK